jgi:hypothetical protein
LGLSLRTNRNKNTGASHAAREILLTPLANGSSAAAPANHSHEREFATATESVGRGHTSRRNSSLSDDVCMLPHGSCRRVRRGQQAVDCRADDLRD